MSVSRRRKVRRRMKLIRAMGLPGSSLDFTVHRVENRATGTRDPQGNQDGLSGDPGHEDSVPISDKLTTCRVLVG